MWPGTTPTSACLADKPDGMHKQTCALAKVRLVTISLSVSSYNGNNGNLVDYPIVKYSLHDKEL